LRGPGLVFRGRSWFGNACGAVRRLGIEIIDVRPFRCLNCGARFYAFARFDERTSVINKAAWAVFSPESDMIENNWWEQYRAAVLEIDPNKLRDRVKAAEDAIQARVSLNGQVTSEERIAIRDAMAALLVLRRELGLSPVNKIKHHRVA
jgi:hypothetical protein